MLALVAANSLNFGTSDNDVTKSSDSFFGKIGNSIKDITGKIIVPIEEPFGTSGFGIQGYVSNNTENYTRAAMIQSGTSTLSNLSYVVAATSYIDDGSNNDDIVLRIYSNASDTNNLQGKYVGLVYSDIEMVNSVLITPDIGGNLESIGAGGFSAQGSSGNYYRDTGVSVSSTYATYPAFVYAIVSEDNTESADDVLIELESVSDGWLIGGQGNKSEEVSSTECCYYTSDYITSNSSQSTWCMWDANDAIWITTLGCTSGTFCYNETTDGYCTLNSVPGRGTNLANESYNLTVAGGVQHVNVTVEDVVYPDSDNEGYFYIANDQNNIVVEVRNSTGGFLGSNITSPDNLVTVLTPSYEGVGLIYINGILTAEASITGAPVAPVFTVITDDHSNFTNPTIEGTNVTFNASATDGNNDNWKLLVCNSTVLSGTSCGETTICESGFVASGSTAECQASTLSDPSLNVSWESFACDAIGCSAAENTTSPYWINHNKTVILVAPEDNFATNINTVNFTCNATDLDVLVNLTLYHNISGAFVENSSTLVTDTVNETNFTAENIPDGDYVWNCRAFDTYDVNSWAQNNNSFTIDTLNPNVSVSVNDTLVGSGIESVLIDWNASDNNLDVLFVNVTMPDGSLLLYETNPANDIILSPTNLTQLGTYTIYAYANDTAGNFNLTQKFFNVADLTPPSATLVFPINTSWDQDGSIVFTCDATNSALANISLYHNIVGIWQLNQTNNVTGTANSTNFTLNNIPDNNTGYIWNCEAGDAAQNYAFASDNWTFYVDTVVPSASISVNETAVGFGLGSVRIDWNASDLNIDTRFMNVTLPDGTLLALETDDTADLVLSPSNLTQTGEYFVYAFINDSAGNFNLTFASFNVTDATAPNVTLVSPANATWDNGGVVTFTCNATDTVLANLSLYHNISGVWMLNQTNVVTGAANQTSFIVDDIADNNTGNYIWSCLSSDLAGNSAFALENRTLYVDASVPSVTIAINDTAVEFNIEKVRIDWNATDANIDYRFVNITYPGGSTLYASTDDTVDFVFVPANLTQVGDYTITVLANDSAGNTNLTVRTFNVNDTTVPEVYIAINDTTLEFGVEKVLIDWNVSDVNFVYGFANVTSPTGILVDYSVDNSTDIVLLPANLTQLGVYTVYAYANDTVGNENLTTATFTVSDTVDPVVQLVTPVNDTWDTDGTVTFTCNATNTALANISLYHNISGVWMLNQTNIVTGAENQTTFVVDDIADNTGYVWNCLAADVGGNDAFASLNWTINADSTTPVVNIEINDTVIEFGVGKVKVDWNASDSYLSYRVANVTYPDGSVLQTLTDDTTDFVFGPNNLTQQGLYTIGVYVNDTAGNLNITFATFNVSDAVPPNVVLISPDDLIWNSNGSVAFRCNSSDKNLSNISLYHNIAEVWQLNETKQLTGTDDGEKFLINNIPDNNTGYLWNCESGDSGKNFAFAASNRTFYVDTTVPSASVAVNDSVVEYADESVLIDWNATDLNLDTVFVNVTMPDGTLLLYETNPANDIILSPTNLTLLGTYTIFAFINDSAGNSNVTVLVFNVADTTPPVVNLVSPVNQTWDDDGNLVLTCNATNSALGNISLYHDIGGNLGLNQTVTVTGASNQTSFLISNVQDNNTGYTWNCEAGDVGNNYAFAADNWTFFVDSVVPSANISVNDTTVEFGDESVMIDWNATDLSLDTVFANVTMPDGTLLLYETNPANDIVLGPVNLTQQGVYTIAAFINDSAGNFNLTVLSFTVSDTVDPFVDLVSPVNDTWDTDGTVTFTCNATNTALTNISLYHNISGVWMLNQTDVVSGAENVSVFVVDDIADNNGYVWNCLAADVGGNDAYAAVNWTINVDSTVPAVVIDINDTNVEVGVEKVKIDWNATDANIDYRNANVTYPDGSLLQVLTDDSNDFVFGPANLTLTGTYTITVYANDSAGNINVSIATFTVGDTIAPYVQLISPLNATWSDNGSVTFRCNATDNNLSNISLYHDIEGFWQLNDTAFVSGTENETLFFINNIPENSTGYQWSCQASDSAGNNAFAGFNRILYVDTLIPTVTIAVNDTLVAFGDESVLIDWNATDVSLVMRFVNVTMPDGTLLLYETNDANDIVLSPTNLTQIGTYTIYAYANDSAGNSNLTVVTFDVQDANVPIISLVAPDDDSYTNDVNMTFECNATDNLGLVNLTLYHNITGAFIENETSLVTGLSDSSQFNVTFIQDGEYLWSCEAYDTSNNSNFALVNYTFIVDTVAPVSGLVSPVNNSVSTTNITFTCNASDETNLGSIVLYHDLSGVFVANQTAAVNGFTNQSSFTVNYIAEGEYKWGCLAIDASNNTLFSHNYTVSVDISAPTIDIFVNNTEPIFGEDSILIDWNVTDNNTDIKFVNVSYPNGTSLLISFDDTQDIVLLPENLTIFGQYLVVVYANDTAGQQNMTNVTFEVTAAGNWTEIVYPTGLFEVDGIYDKPVTLDTFYLQINGIESGPNDTIECYVWQANGSYLILNHSVNETGYSGYNLTFNHSVDAASSDGSYNQSWFVENCSLIHSTGYVVMVNDTDYPVYVKSTNWYNNSQPLDAANAYQAYKNAFRWYFSHDDATQYDVNFAFDKFIGVKEFEGVCDDNADNDSDGLVDCADPDCQALFFSCANHTLEAGAGGFGTFGLDVTGAQVTDVGIQSDPPVPCIGNICSTTIGTVTVYYTQEVAPGGQLKVKYLKSITNQITALTTKSVGVPYFNMTDAGTSLYGLNGASTLDYKLMTPGSGPPYTGVQASSRPNGASSLTYTGNMDMVSNISMAGVDVGNYTINFDVYINGGLGEGNFTVYVDNNESKNLYENDTGLQHVTTNLLNSTTTFNDQACNDGIDNDLNYDGMDCNDTDCNGVQVGVTLNSDAIYCEYGTELTCWDGFDNDKDGLVDCADPDCNNQIGGFVFGGVPVKYNVSSTYVYCESGATAEGTIHYATSPSSCNDLFNNDADAGNQWDNYGCANTTECQSEQIDCYDEYSCWGRSGGVGGVCPLFETSCNDGVDNDFDQDLQGGSANWQSIYVADPGLDSSGADCDDYDCFGNVVCPSDESSNVSWCFDNIDNDLDAYYWSGADYVLNTSTGFDCDDPDCFLVSDPSSGKTCIPQEFKLFEYDYCRNTLDDDFDGVNPDGQSSCIDNQFNSSLSATNVGALTNTDCWARFNGCGPCPSTENYTSSSCSDNIDNDYDDGAGTYGASAAGSDCSDSDCLGMVGSSDGDLCMAGEITDAACSDGFDNDADGNADCADADCQALNSSYCSYENATGVCSDDLDNDGDGLIDCVDTGCYGVASCDGVSWTTAGLTTVPATSSWLTISGTQIEYRYTTRVHKDKPESDNLTVEFRSASGNTHTTALVQLNLGTAQDNLSLNMVASDIKLSGASASDFTCNATNGCWVDEVLTLKDDGNNGLQLNGGTLDLVVNMPIKADIPLAAETFPASANTQYGVGSTPGNSFTVYESNAPNITNIEIESSALVIDYNDNVYVRAIPEDDSSVYACNFVFDGVSSTETDCIYNTAIIQDGVVNVDVNATDQYSNIGAVNSTTLNISVNPIDTTSNYSLTRAFYSGAYTKLEMGGYDFITGVGDTFGTSCTAVIENATGVVYVNNSAFVNLGGQAVTCSGNISLPASINLRDGIYYAYVNVTDSDGDIVRSDSKVFYVCNNYTSTGTGWSCQFADIDNDGATEGFNHTIYGFSSACDNCLEIYNPNQSDSDADGFGDPCDMITFMSTLFDKDGNPLAGNYTLYSPGTNAVQYSGTFNGTLNITISEQTYDLEIITDDPLILLLRDFSTTVNNNKSIGMDCMDTPTLGYLVVCAVNTSYSFSIASLTLSYQGTNYSKEENLQGEICTNWDFLNEVCLSSFQTAVDVAKNGTIEIFMFNTTSFSAFAVREAVPGVPGTGTGGGGGSGRSDCNDGRDNDDDGLIDMKDPGCVGIWDDEEYDCTEDWVCEEWEECEFGYSERECEDQNECGTESDKPRLRELCYTCSDGKLNQGETGIDCGGPCEPCPSCYDGVQNNGEEGVDCGGPCDICLTCTDGIQNQDETGVDCGGLCKRCPIIEIPLFVVDYWLFYLILVAMSLLLVSTEVAIRKTRSFSLGYKLLNLDSMFLGLLAVVGLVAHKIFGFISWIFAVEAVLVVLIVVQLYRYHKTLKSVRFVGRARKRLFSLISRSHYALEMGDVMLSKKLYNKASLEYKHVPQEKYYAKLMGLYNLLSLNLKLDHAVSLYKMVIGKYRVMVYLKQKELHGVLSILHKDLFELNRRRLTLSGKDLDDISKLVAKLDELNRGLK